MSSSTGMCSEREQVFLRSGLAATQGMWLLLAGIGGLCFVAIGFVLAIKGRPGQFAMHGMTTLPAILSIGALTGGWILLRTPHQVAVSPSGLTIETRRGARRLGWDEVGSATVQTGGLNHRRFLNVTDLQGKSIARLDESFNRFDEMTALVARLVEAKGDDTALRILRKKARRNGVLMCLVGLGMAAGCPFLAWETYKEQRGARLLREKGEPGEGEIVRRFVAPNGVTKRIEYRVMGSPTRNVEVEPAYWDRLEGARSVPVVYVPGEPQISRLENGERTDSQLTESPAIGYGFAALSGLIGLLMLGGSPFAWNGWDLAHDSKTQKWSIKRYGKVVWGSCGQGDRPAATGDDPL